jgi:polygalacturonase
MTRFYTRREAISAMAAWSGATLLPAMRLGAQTAPVREFNVLDYGAAGDGTTLDSAAIQRTIEAAAAAGAGARVVVPGGRRFLVGRLELKGAIEFHLADDAELLASEHQEDYGERGALLTARDVAGLRITGTGRINGHAREFMSHYDDAEEWWRPKPFRPRLAVLVGCRDLEVSGITFHDAPSWTLHLVGCERVLVDRVKIRNQLDVPNCDGIDPDHCRDVEIQNCDIVCGDDAIVIKATRRFAEFGGSHNIHVHDCVLATQDSGVKIGTETTRDITNVRFERCEIRQSCRGCTIQLRDEGDVRGIVFRDINFTAQYFSDPWWGRGEAISFTALPRNAETKLGRISDVRVENVTGRAENSLRISGSRESRIENVRFENVAVTLDRWTKYRGGVWDNRPTSVYPPIEEHATPAFHVRHADDVELRNCRVAWGENRPEYFTHALEAHDVTGLTYPDFVGKAAHPARDAAIVVR